MCLLTNSPTSPACGANRLDTPSSMASATSSLVCSTSSTCSTALSALSGRNSTPLSLDFRAFRRRRASATDKPSAESSVSGDISFFPRVVASPVSGAGADEGVAASFVVAVVRPVCGSASLWSSARCLNCFRFLLGLNMICGSGFVSPDEVSMMGYRMCGEARRCEAMR